MRLLGKRRTLEHEYRDCPVHRSDELNARVIVLPNGTTWAVFDDDFAETVVNALTDPDNATERYHRKLAVLKRMATPEEWAEAERVVAELGRPSPG